MKEEEKKPIPWEAGDPKPPVIRSGRMQNLRKKKTELTDWSAPSVCN